MDALITGLLTSLTSLGPLGALAAAAIVGLALAVIAFAKSKDLWADTKGRSQGIEFQDRLLTMIDKLTASEDAARKRIEEMGRETVAMRDELDELRASLALLRNQRRKLIELLRQERHGKVAGTPRRVGVTAA